MLCNTFSVAITQQTGLDEQQSQIEDRLAANNNSTLNQPPQTSDLQQQQQQHNSDSDGCFSVLGNLIDGRDRANSYNLLETEDKARGRYNDSDTFHNDKLSYNSNHSSQDSYQLLNWQSNRSSESNNKLSSMVTANNMSSLSCLITPIRRSNLSSSMNQQTNDKQQCESRNFFSGK